MIDKLHRRIKLKITIISLLLVVLSIITLPETKAYLSWASKEPLNNIFKIEKPNIEIEEVFDKEVKSEVLIKNEGNVAVYARVKVIPYYTYDGNIMGLGDSFNLMIDDSNWIDVDGIYYYRVPIEPGEATGNLLKEVISNNKRKGMNLKVDVLAQSYNANQIKEIEDVWQVKIVNGKIVGGKR